MTEIHPLMAILHHATHKYGYEDIVIDCTELTAAFPGPMVSLCSKVLSLREDKISTELILPKNETLSRLFFNTNWANIICPSAFYESKFKGYTHVPTIRFRDHDEQGEAVNKILDAILSSITTIERRDLAAVEWSINEITDNVLVHAESNIGGLLQLSSFNTRQKRIEYVVCDSGVGIPSSLKNSLKNVNSDVEVLDMSIKEGVTNGKGAGNGLFGSFQTSSASGGYFNMHSGNASLTFNPNPKIGKRIINEKVPFSGTLVVACLDYSIPKLLENALVFKGQKPTLSDFLEIRYEDDFEDKINFRLVEESKSFGTRPAGLPIRNKLLNLLKSYPKTFPIIVDFESVPTISSSYADEIFGKLFLEIGSEVYNSRIILKNIDNINKMLIDRSLSQRGFV